ncbi:unnamed protein product [Caenorhabditis angaria]|uniref:RING-type domain-containing protein n=1 Tax=Caenorhabditis angaria TaxID=860376 RepID=A0A9P1J1Y2_9PELO|nr:unnamed protein product [Caenorhabditis angaria]
MDNESIFTCSICYLEYDEGVNCPKVLKCGHTFCDSCVKHNIQNRTTIACFKCRAESDLNTTLLDWFYQDVALLFYWEQWGGPTLKTLNVPNPVVVENVEELNLPTCRLCDVEKISKFCDNAECSLHELKTLCSNCFVELHPECWSMSIANANLKLNKQVEMFIDKKLIESDKSNEMKGKIEEELKKKQDDQNRKIDEYYEKFRKEIEDYCRRSKEQLNHLMNLYRNETTARIAKELDVISIKAYQAQELRDNHSQDLINVYPELFELFQSTSGVSEPIQYNFKDPKVQPNGLKWFPTYDIMVIGDWEIGQIWFFELLKEKSFGVTETEGKCELYYGATQLCFHFTAPASIQIKYKLHFTQFENAHPQTDCKVITITDRRNQRNSFYLPIDPVEQSKAERIIHEILRDTFF